MQEILEAILNDASGPELLALPLPGTFRAATVHKDDVELFAGLLSEEKDPKKSIHIDQVRPDAMLLLTIVSALIAGPERGAVLGFAAGVLVDLTLQTPFGLSALVLCLVGFAVGQLQAAILRSAWSIPHRVRRAFVFRSCPIARRRWATSSFAARKRCRHSRCSTR